MHILKILLVPLLLLAALTAAAIDVDEVMRLKESGEILPLEKILQQVRRDFPGRIIEIELDKEDGQYVYEIEFVDENGFVWDLDLDARTGQLLKLKRDD